MVNSLPILNFSMFQKILSILFCLLNLVISFNTFSQESAPGIIITCPAPHKEDAHSYVFNEQSSENLRTAQTATFIVEYIGFTDEARIAFQHAVNIWQSRIHSSVPIKIRATWKSLDSGILGSAGSTTVYRNFDGAPQWNTWYPVALAEKLGRRELNDPAAADIVADFNSDASWYLGIDGRPPSRTTDFVTVVLHEIAHGLGFVSTMDIEDNQGSWGTSNFGLAFDHFIENGTSQKLTNTSLFPNPSTALANQLTSDNIFFRGPVITERHVQRPKLFAPTTFDLGSSISHLDERSYPPGDINSLMTPQIATAEAIHEPGPVLLNMFAELGWESTFIDVSANKDIEDPLSPVVIRAVIYTENVIKPETLILHYSTNNFGTSSQAQMQPTQNANEYAVTIPAPMVAVTISYYIHVSDNFNRNFSSPSNTPTNYHQIRVGPDLVPPVVNHDPLKFIFVSDLTVLISAVVTDNLGLRDVTVEYSINDENQPSFTLAHIGNDVYVGDFKFLPGQLSPGDEIKYRIIARDASRNVNTTIRPVQGFYSVNVRDIFLPQNSYINDFTESTEDFTGNGFRITRPPTFNDPAIHTDHPYDDGSNYHFQLLVPFVVEPFDAIMRWSEIVLIEPGEPGSEYGDSDFYDYVIIEGSNDDGQTWIPLIPGYDSRKHPVWLNHYNNDLVGDVSEGEGDPSLFRRDSLDLLDTFSPGDIIFIRFRLFSDEAAYGWGWAIDDLNIQGVPRKLKNELMLRPNPSEGVFFLEIPIPERTRQADIRIYDIKGQEVFYRNYSNPNTRFVQEFDFRDFPPGVYVVKFQSDNISTSKRLLLK